MSPLSLTIGISLAILLSIVSVNAKLFTTNDQFGPCLQTYRVSGETCSKDFDYSCLPMFTKCVQERSGQFCRPFSYASGNCTSTSDCAGADVVTMCSKSQCAFKNKGLGDKCTENLQCGKGQCHPVEKVCKEPKDGYLCLRHSECSTSKYCYGSCKPKKTAGQTCTNNFECVEGSTCFFGVCRTRAITGGQCLSINDCEEGTYCDGSVCVTRKSLGATCADDVECDISLGCIEQQCKPRNEKYICNVGDHEACGPVWNSRFCSCGFDKPQHGWCVPDIDIVSGYEFELLNMITYIHEKDLKELDSCSWTKCGLRLKDSYVAVFDEANCIRRECSSLFPQFSDQLTADLKKIGVTFEIKGDTSSATIPTLSTLTLVLMLIISLFV